MVGLVVSYIVNLLDGLNITPESLQPSGCISADLNLRLSQVHRYPEAKEPVYPAESQSYSRPTQPGLFTWRQL